MSTPTKLSNVISDLPLEYVVDSVDLDKSVSLYELTEIVRPLCPELDVVGLVNNPLYSESISREYVKGINHVHTGVYNVYYSVEDVIKVLDTIDSIRSKEYVEPFQMSYDEFTNCV